MQGNINWNILRVVFFVCTLDYKFAWVYQHRIGKMIDQIHVQKLKINQTQFIKKRQWSLYDSIN